MLVKNSFVCLDSNICIYRCLSLIEPKIYDKQLDKSVQLVNDVTNNNYQCKIVLLPTVINEIINSNDETYILSKEIQHFGIKVLKLKKNSYKLKKIENSALKSLKKFVAKYSYAKNFQNMKFTYVHMSKIRNFYLNYPSKLLSITNQKLSRIKDSAIKQKKIKQRNNNLPENSDLKILDECLELNDINTEDFCLITNDSDFTKFISEIKKEFSIIIIDFSQYNSS